ncbi:GNAT family N-acetyltransferase [Pseudoduganella sp. FT55W]|uniref:GNAT family N-acetyltransferase n=1 Tax=Duganella rivi TaxID=2666083 RepID=A0A7X4GSU2_9BURK|nr:GNAT family N-acetyltransferase [Duganella rivi]MYM69013.1 GNAT family N-acetyltransferase [Duganella rivi]
MLRPLFLRLRGARQRTVAAVLLLLQAVIFLLDTGTGAAISYAPFYSVPVALAAWRLPPLAAAGFVAVATVARVYDYTNHHHDSLLLLSYDLAQSAAFYALVAWLAWQARRTRERLVQRARRLQRQARRERHRRVLDATIRRAVLDDVAGIIGLTATGDDAFDQQVMNSEHQAALARVFSAGIVEGTAPRTNWDGGRSTVPVEFWVSEIGGQLAGYMMVMGVDGSKGPERELHALAVAPAFRNQGVGAMLVNFFCAHHRQRRLLVACKPGSQMMQMLERRHFHHYASSAGYEIMALG